jgi:hypothetical protein
MEQEPVLAACPSCGGEMPGNLLACSGACMRIERFRAIAAGERDPMNE